jgi:Protein of unknown function (DUF1573)
MDKRLTAFSFFPFHFIAGYRRLIAKQPLVPCSNHPFSMYILLLSAATLLFCGCHASKATPIETAVVTPAPAPAKSNGFVQWDKKMIDLGVVKKGTQPAFFYEFTNVSAEPVKIEIVDACDCTKVEWPRGTIAPGAKGRLDVVFKSGDKDASETIGINVVFSNLAPDGNPRIEVVEYKFELSK